MPADKFFEEESMSTIYIHAGTPKTGTSAIQFFCSKNRKILKQMGICYPNMGFEFPGIGVNRNGHFMNRRITDDSKNRLREEEQALVDKGFEKIKKLLGTYPNVVLSDEQFWNNKEMDQKKWAYYKERFAQMGADLKVIVYLRRQDLLIQSYWAQQVKETMTVSFKKYIESEKYKYFKVNYDERLEEIAAGVGKENVIVRVYEKQQYYGGSILSDFLHIFDIELNDQFKQPEKTVNVSLDGACLEVKRLLNNSPVYKTKKNFLVPLLTDIQQEQSGQVGYTTGKYFSSRDQREFMEKFREGNEKVAREFLGREDGVLFRDEMIASEDDKATKYSTKELVLLLGDVIARQQELIDEKDAQIAEMKKPVTGVASIIKKAFR
jgi:hypothetical protein